MAPSGRDCAEFLQWACPKLGLRWDGFRRVRGQVCKRIHRRMKMLGLESQEQYRALLERDAAEWLELDAMCRVTITRFYRDRGVFDALRTVHLPKLVAKSGALRIWSAGCGSGEEPYTCAMILHFDHPSVRAEILASDADANLLERARVGCYQGGSLRELPREWIDAAFEKPSDATASSDRPRPGPTHWCLRAAFRAPVRFEVRDLRRELPEGPFDVLLCRNVVFTYVARDAQLPILAELTNRLRPDAPFVIGAHESLPEGADRYLAETGNRSIYVRRESWSMRTSRA